MPGDVKLSCCRLFPVYCTASLVTSGSSLSPGLRRAELSSATGFLTKQVGLIFKGAYEAAKEDECGTEMHFMFVQTVTNGDVVSTDGWLVANINMTGFYRVNYDSANWERLLAKLNTKPQVGKTGNDATRFPQVFLEDWSP